MIKNLSYEKKITNSFGLHLDKDIEASNSDLKN